MVFSQLRLGGVHRTDHVVLAAGGKGLNVARAARTLGQPLHICGPLGGLTGQLVARLADQEGFECYWSWHMSGETRTCVLVVDPQGGDATALNESGPIFAPSDWAGFVDMVVAAAADVALVTISGSLPPGAPTSALGDLTMALSAAGRRVMVDSSGAPLRSALVACPYALKVNAAELGAALDRTIDDVSQAAVALKALRRQGIALAVVSMGALGAVGASEQGYYHVCPPKLDIVSSVGSGDSLMAGLAAGLLRGYTLPDALQLGVACGAADALTIGGGLIHMEDVERIRAATDTTVIPEADVA